MWDIESEISILTLCNEVAPVRLDELRWEIPMIEIGYMVAKGASKMGVKGIGTRPRGEECLARLNKLMADRLAELGK